MITLISRHPPPAQRRPGHNAVMQPAVIAAVITATVAITTAAFTAVNSQRQKYREQRNQWLHERRKDAYLRFIDAARAFLPLTESVVRHEEHMATEPPTDDAEHVTVTSDGDHVIFLQTASDFLPPSVDVLSEEWVREAPGKLTELTAAWDRLDTEAPDEEVPDGNGIRQLAREIRNLAHWLAESRELLPLELQQEQEHYDAEDGSGPTEVQYLTSYISAYHTASARFRRKAREDLDALTPQPARLALLLRGH